MHVLPRLVRGEKLEGTEQAEKRIKMDHPVDKWRHAHCTRVSLFRIARWESLLRILPR